MSEHVLALISGELQEALVDLDEAQVREATDDGWGRVGPEGALEAVLGFHLPADVMDDKHKTVWIAVLIGDDEAADAVGPVPIRVILVGHHDHNIVEDLARDEAFDGIAVGIERPVVAVVQNEVALILVDSPAERIEAGRRHASPAPPHWRR